MRHVFVTMRTVASLTVPAGLSPDDLAEVECIFETADATFSLYRADSELSRVNRGELALAGSSTRLRGAYETAIDWGWATSGVFTSNRPDGSIDLNGVVKALAIEEAAELLDHRGTADWSINVGGDLLFRGEQSLGEPWTTGIVDPRDRHALLCSLELREQRRAVATSGSAERGDHIWRGGSTSPSEFTQVTVIANNIVEADVLATAVVAGGSSALDDLTGRRDIDVLAVARSGQLLATPGIRSALARPRV